MKSLRVKKKWVQDYKDLKTLIEDLEVIYEFFKEEEATQEDVENRYNKASILIEDIEFRNMLSEEGDGLSAVLQITAGAGGTESCDWASMLMGIYLMYAEKSGFVRKAGLGIHEREGLVASVCHYVQTRSNQTCLTLYSSLALHFSSSFFCARRSTGVTLTLKQNE